MPDQPTKLRRYQFRVRAPTGERADDLFTIRAIDAADAIVIYETTDRARIRKETGRSWILYALADGDCVHCAGGQAFVGPCSRCAGGGSVYEDLR
jgi:hypothetical protein